jgi:DNA-binding response OmpR family regulator
MLSQKILFVDDDPDWRFFVKDWLEDAGFAVTTAPDATQALVETGGFPHDLIILDLNLGGENGFVLMNFLKLNYPQVPFLLYTGMPPAEVAARANPRAEHQSYLRKGKMEDLILGVQGALAHEQRAVSFP